MSTASSTRRSSFAAVASILTSNSSANTNNNTNNTNNTTINSSSASNISSNLPQIITPKIQENVLGDVIQFRTNILPDFKELGQPDLVHLSKYDKSSKQEIGEYHYVVGINTSSAVQPFMYLQTIQLNDKEIATNKHNKIGTYCSYNLFSKGDLRIRCQFPNSTTPMIQFVPSNKNKISINLNNVDNDNKHKTIWLETYVSSLIRCFLFTDSIERHLPGMCKFNPIQSTKDSKEAIKLLCSFLNRGIETGCSDIFNRPSLVNNYLVDTLFKILSLTNYYDLAIEEIKNIMQEYKINLNVLIVRILLLKNDIAKAVRLMRDCLLKIPRDGWMLNEQCKFLISQNRSDLALLPAKISVESLPSEFQVWKNLISIYILRNDFKNALLALNSSPMYINKRKDIYSAIKPKSFEFPFPLEGKILNVWKDCELFGCISGIGGIVEFSTNEELEKVSKYRLRVYEETKLNFTFKEAYDLLALMNKKCGWGELLKIRSEVFVMEDEYKQLSKAETDIDSNLDEEFINNDISSKFKSKRLSEKWLDSLFLIFYENLKNILIYKNDKSKNNQYTALEWELIGEECYKVHFFEESILPFKNCLQKRFSVFASYKILKYFLEINQNDQSFKILNNLNNDETKDKEIDELDNDFILHTCCKLISWSARYYGEFPILCLQVMKTLMKMADYDATVLKSQLEFTMLEQHKNKLKNDNGIDKSLLKEMEYSQNISGIVERYLSWLDQFV